jgi:hypothetical protein
MNASIKPAVLVSPTPLVLSLLYAGRRMPVTIARSHQDFMMRALRESTRVIVVERGWLSVLDLRRLALRRALSPNPRLVLVLGRDEVPTPFERARFDAVVVAGTVFLKSATQLQLLVGALPKETGVVRSRQAEVESTPMSLAS